MKKKSIIVAIALLACTFVSCERENTFKGSGTNNKIGVDVSGTESVATKSGASSANLIGSTVIEDVNGQNFVLDMYVEDNDTLPFDESFNTKGSIVTSTSINATGKQFAFNGWLRSTNRYPNNSGSTGPFCEEDETNYHFVNTTATKGSEGWTMGQEAFWRNAVPTTFWSYYPVTDDARVLSLPGQTPTDTEQDAFSFTYTTPESVTAQNDLLFAYNLHTFSAESEIPSDGETVNIDFYHALAAIRFDVSGVENTFIDNVSFTGIAVAGNCDVSGGATAAGGKTPGKVTFAWTPGTTDTRSQALSPKDFTETGLDGKTENALMPLSSSKFFFFIPQEIKDKGVKIGITFKNLGVDVTKTVDLNHAAAWEAGKVYTYKLGVQGDVADAEVTATIETTYSDKNVTGSDAKLTLTKKEGTVDKWTLKNVKFSQNGVDFRSTASVDVSSGIAVTITPVTGKPYMPKTDTGGPTYNWTADIYYTVGGSEHFLKTVSGTVDAPGPDADKFEIKMDFDGYTNFSVAKGYDGQTKNIEKANNTDEGTGGMDKETVYNVGGKRYVSGLSVDVKTQCASLLKCENEDTKYDGSTVSGTGVKYTKQSWAAHTISCYAEFDGVSPNTQPSKKVHITGLPFYNKPPENSGDHPWIVGIDGSDRTCGDITWGKDRVEMKWCMSKAICMEPRIVSPYFHIPEDVDVKAYGDIRRDNNTFHSYLEIYNVYRTQHTDERTKMTRKELKKNEQWTGPWETTMDVDHYRFDITYTYATAGPVTYVYEFNVIYRDDD